MGARRTRASSILISLTLRTGRSRSVVGRWALGRGCSTVIAFRLAVPVVAVAALSEEVCCNSARLGDFVVAARA